MTPGLVSAIIVNWNGARFLPTCLRALRSQDYTPIEVIVVDNGSQDGSAESITADPRIHLIRNPRNLGFAVANNIGLKVAQGEFILLLNYDVVLEPGYVSRLVSALRTDPQRGSTSGKLLRPPSGMSAQLVDSAGHLIYRNLWSVNRGEDEPDGAAYATAQEVFGVSAAATLYRRAMLDDVMVHGEVFDSTFFAYLEDVDLDWRARIRGWRSWYEPAAVAIHRRSGSGAWYSSRMQGHMLKNRILTIVKNDAGPGMYRRLPGVLAFTGAKLVQLLLTRPAALRGIWDAARLLPSAWRKRRQIQSLRAVPPRDLERWFQPYPYLEKLRQGRWGRSRRKWISQS